MSGLKHPYYAYSLTDALSLATILKKDRLQKEMKMKEARTMAPFTAENLDEAIEVMREEIKCCTFNWITGRVALEVLRVANGEENVFKL